MIKINKGEVAYHRDQVPVPSCPQNGVIWTALNSLTVMHNNKYIQSIAIKSIPEYWRQQFS